MIELKPKPENHFICPECRSGFPAINGILLQPVHTVADCTCEQCGLRFYQTYPVGHTVNEHLTMGRLSGRLYQSNGSDAWLSESLLKAHFHPKKHEVTIKRLLFKEYEDVIILNTLDFLYGHVLLKLCNSLYHLDHQKEFGLIVIIPKIFEWLIPKGCAEAWVVDLKLSELAHGYEAIQKFVAGAFSGFRRIYLSKAYSHPDFSSIDISRLTGIKPFDLNEFEIVKPLITFVLREDRWWLNNKIDYWIYRVCRKLRVQAIAGSLLSRRQNSLVIATIRNIREKIPEAGFHIVGLGKTGSFDGYAADERKLSVTPDDETEWCKIYKRSHVVIGVHGSNMLLPTALAAGCVEILPQDRYGNMVQDLSVRYNDRRQLFFYRFVDQYSNPMSVASKTVAMISDYQMYHRNMCSNQYS